MTLIYVYIEQTYMYCVICRLPYEDGFLFSADLQFPTLPTRRGGARSFADATQDDGGARPCTCGDSTCCSSWRFGYRKSEYNIGVPSVSAFLRASDVISVPSRHLVDAETRPCRPITGPDSTPVYATPARESPTIYHNSPSGSALNLDSRLSRCSINRSSTIFARHARHFRTNSGA